MTADYENSSRVDWIDASKGLMIILVVLGHVWRGLHTKGLIADQTFSSLDSRIYAFHMPVFFAIAGWFFLSSISPLRFFEFSKRRALRLFFPMVLWTYIFLGAKVLAGDLANSPIEASEIWVSPVPGVLHLWFLWALLILNFAFFVFKPLVEQGQISATALWLAGAAILTLQFLELPEDLARWVRHAINNAPYFFLGMVLGQRNVQFQFGIGGLVIAIVSFVILLVFWPRIQELGFELSGSLILVVCILIIMSRSKTIIGRWGTETLCKLGVASMAIYLAHTIFAAAAREYLLLLGIRDATLHVFLGMMVGIIGPITLLIAARFTKTTRILGFE